MEDCWSLRLQGVVRDQIEWVRKNSTSFPDSLYASFIRQRQRTEGVCQDELSWIAANNNDVCAPKPFAPHTFLQHWAGRTLVMAGDSLSKMLYLDLTESLIAAGLNITVRSNFQHLDLMYRSGMLFQCRAFQQDCILCFFWGPGSILNPWHGNGDALAPVDGKSRRHAAIFRGNLGPEDVILWNAGVHEKANSAGLQQLRQRVSQIVSSYHNNNNAGRQQEEQAQLWWRETLPQHFRAGSYQQHAERQCYPAESFHPQTATTTTRSQQQQLGVYNEVTSPIVVAAGVPVMHTYATALPLHDAHYKPGLDCTHFCDGPWGPNNLHKAILTTMARDAVRAGALPKTGQRRTLQERWDALVEHPTTSALAKLEICAHKQFQWDIQTSGELPPALASCLCSSIQKNHTKPVRKGVIEHLNLEQRCRAMVD